jgi:hypothetical protein
VAGEPPGDWGPRAGARNASWIFFSLPFFFSPFGESQRGSLSHFRCLSSALIFSKHVIEQYYFILELACMSSKREQKNSDLQIFVTAQHMRGKAGISFG